MLDRKPGATTLVHGGPTAKSETVGKQTLVQATPSASAPIQRRVEETAAARDVPNDQAHAAAARATSGPGRSLPYLDVIQRAFGRHDVSGIRAHTGEAAAEGSAAMGASAFAQGSAVAFARAPDLRTAAHEAAHVVQQRAGISVPGGVGAEGDPHEQQADEVADRVVAGKSAEDVLDRMAGGGPTSATTAVQRCVVKGPGGFYSSRDPATLFPNFRLAKAHDLQLAGRAPQRDDEPRPRGRDADSDEERSPRDASPKRRREDDRHLEEDAAPDEGPPMMGQQLMAPRVMGPPTMGPPTMGPPTMGPPTMGPPTMGLPMMPTPMMGPPTMGPPMMPPPTMGALKVPAPMMGQAPKSSEPSVGGPKAKPAGTFAFRGAKSAMYREIVDELQGADSSAALVRSILAGGDITIATDDKDDTRFDRKTRTVFVSKTKSKDQARAAILFELVNAGNDHRYTDAAESGLVAMEEGRKTARGADLAHVATEMEKDEFISLSQYAQIVETMPPMPSASGEAMREKYGDVVAEGGGSLDYDKYVKQNAMSGHTKDLAEAQHANVSRGRAAEMPPLPYQYRNPGPYYQATATDGKEKRRSVGLAAAQIEREKQSGMNDVASELTDRAPPFDPAAIAERFPLK